MQRIMQRCVTYLPFKAICTPIGISVFFISYFGVMKHPAPFAEVHVVPLLIVDHWITVQEWALIPYASLWLYVCLASALICTRTELFEYMVGTSILCITGLAIFWLFPTTVPDFNIDWHLYPALAFLKNADGGANALPSLHVAFAVFTAAFLRVQLRACGAPFALRTSNMLWAALIVYSTLATRQHVFLDVMSGTILGLLAFAPLHRLGNMFGRTTFADEPRVSSTTPK